MAPHPAGPPCSRRQRQCSGARVKRASPTRSAVHHCDSRRCEAASDGITWHQVAPDDIIRHQAPSGGITWHQVAPDDIIRHQMALDGARLHQAVPGDIRQSQPQHQTKPDDINTIGGWGSRLQWATRLQSCARAVLTYWGIGKHNAQNLKINIMQNFQHIDNQLQA